MKLIATYIGLSLISAITFAEPPTLREHCEWGLSHARESIIMAESMTDYYYYCGKIAAFNEIMNYIEAD